MSPPPARIVTESLDLSKAFDTINIHTLIRKLLQTNTPCTIMKLIANYTTHPHYLTFILQTYHHPEHRFRSWPIQLTTPSHLHTQACTSAAKEYIQSYLHKGCAWTSITISHQIQTKQLAFCSLQTLRNIRAILTSK